MLRAFSHSMPSQWALANVSLGSALRALGLLLVSAPVLAEAVAACELAFGEGKRRNTPLDLVVMEHELGGALLALGRIRSGTASLEEAVAHFRSALQSPILKGIPQLRATIEANLKSATELLKRRKWG